MGSIVLELQRDALDKGVAVPDLLRKALVVAKKLRLEEFEEWIKYELNGYPTNDDSKIPPYRRLRVEVKAWNPYQGWQSVFFENAEDAERFSKRACMQQIAEIQNLLDNRGDDGRLAMPFNSEAERALQKAMDFDGRIMGFHSPAAPAAVLDAVRTTILNWTLELEQRGVVGDDLSFSEQERVAAAQVPQITTLILGPVQSAQIQQGSPQTIQVNLEARIDLDQVREFLVRLRKNLTVLALTDEQRATVEVDVATIQLQVASPAPKPSVIRDCLSSVRRVLEGIAGGAGGQFLAAEITRLLGG